MHSAPEKFFFLFFCIFVDWFSTIEIKRHFKLLNIILCWSYFLIWTSNTWVKITTQPFWSLEFKTWNFFITKKGRQIFWIKTISFYLLLKLFLTAMYSTSRSLLTCWKSNPAFWNQSHQCIRSLYVWLVKARKPPMAEESFTLWEYVNTFILINIPVESSTIINVSVLKYQSNLI